MSILIAIADTAVDVVTDANVASWANLSATALIGALLVWIITKAFPKMLDRHDTVQEQTRAHFERILTNIETSRSTAAREGHDAAKQLAGSISTSNEAVRENTRAIDGLSQKISNRAG